jgi:hypothetical protein
MTATGLAGFRLRPPWSSEDCPSVSVILLSAIVQTPAGYLDRLRSTPLIAPHGTRDFALNPGWVIDVLRREKANVLRANVQIENHTLPPKIPQKMNITEKRVS